MAQLFIEVLQHYRRQGKYLLHEFVLMPDHFHVLITPTITLERALQLIRRASMIGGSGISKCITLFGSTFASMLAREGWLLCRRNIFSARRGRDLIWLARLSGL